MTQSLERAAEKLESVIGRDVMILSESCVTVILISLPSVEHPH